MRIPALILVYFSIATVLAEIGLCGVLWAKGVFDQERLVQLVAVAYDIDLHAKWREMEAAARPIKKAQVSHFEVLHTRQAKSLNLDLREIASQKGVNDLRQLKTMLERERLQYQEVRDSFEQKLEQARQGAVDQSLLDVQRQLESLPPKLAKDQILRILDDPTLDPNDSLQFVVTIVKVMQLEKRKKILAEFKNEDSDRLEEILRQIRLGVPDVELIRETRDQLKQFETRQ